MTATKEGISEKLTCITIYIVHGSLTLLYHLLRYYKQQIQINENKINVG